MVPLLASEQKGGSKWSPSSPALGGVPFWHPPLAITKRGAKMAPLLFRLRDIIFQ